MKNNKFSDENLQNIKKIFEEKTDVRLNHAKYMSKKQPRKPFHFAFVAMVAVICLAVFGNIFLKPQEGNEVLQNNNMFAVKAYAMEQLSDGTMVFQEIDLISHPKIQIGYLDGENYYLNIGLKCEGENIKSVEFSTEEGFFAKQHEENVTRNILAIDVDAVNIPLPVDDFEKVGKKLTLYSDTLTNDVLFLGMENLSMKNIPKQVTIHAIATFDDGRTQEEVITLDYSDKSIVVEVGFDLEDIKRWEKDNVDTLRVEEIFIAQMKDQGYKEVRVNDIKFHDWIGKSIWHISFETDHVTNKVLYVSVSIPPDGEYIVEIIGENP